MNFDLNQLLQGPMRDLVLNQVTKQFGLSGESSGNLLNKGLSLVLGGMTQKASNVEGATGLFNLIKNSVFQGNPLDALTGKAADNGQLLEAGKNLLPSLFGERADAITSYLSESTNTNPTAAKGILGMLLPVVFSFFKGKILGGLGLGGFTKLLGDQTKSLSANLDSKSLSALGFSGGSLDGILSNMSKAGAAVGASAAAVKTAAQGAVAEQAKSSGLGKWLVAGGVLLAALFGIKSCSDNKETAAAPAPAPAVETAKPAEAPAAPVAETVKVSEGLGNLGWMKTDKDLTVTGTVQNEETKAGILDAFKGLAGDLPLVDKLVVDAKADKFSFNNFAGLAGLLKEFPNVNGSFADKAFNLVGQVASDDAKSGLIEKAKSLLGSAFSINADGIKVDAPVAKLVDGLGDLAWAKTDKDFTVSGTVQNEETKAGILDAFKGLAADLPLVDKLVVDAKADKFAFNNFAGLAGVFKDFPKVNGAFADKAFNLFGLVSDENAKSDLVSKAKSVLGDVFTINADRVSVQAEPASAAPQAPAIDMSASKLKLDIVFNTGSSEISSRDFDLLNAFAKYLVENKRGGEIAGYTDNVGDAAANQKLSERRANAVREYLVKQGVPAEALTAVGYGSENPIADNSTAEGRNKNRRIEFNAR